MWERLRESQHLVRAALLFAAVFILFLVARAALVPKDFGQLGHYRAGALGDARTHPLSFAGRAACGECHGDVVEARKGGKHERIGCEACHGALGRHAGDPEAMTPVKPDGGGICLVCHLANVAKPKAFPQVDPAEHGDGQGCDACHRPHHPEIGQGGGA